MLSQCIDGRDANTTPDDKPAGRNQRRERYEGCLPTIHPPHWLPIQRELDTREQSVPLPLRPIYPDGQGLHALSHFSPAFPAGR